MFCSATKWLIHCVKYTPACILQGLFITQYIRSVYSTKVYSLHNIYAANIPKGVGDRFIAPASSTKTIGCNLQNITDCNAYNGKTQHHFREFRGHGHDKSAPYAYGVNVGKRGITVNIHNEITMPTVETKYEKNNIA